jgi:hypothetical protein
MDERFCVVGPSVQEYENVPLLALNPPLTEFNVMDPVPPYVDAFTLVEDMLKG